MFTFKGITLMLFAINKNREKARGQEIRTFRSRMNWLEENVLAYAVRLRFPILISQGLSKARQSHRQEQTHSSVM